MAIAWIIGFSIYFTKRYRRRKHRKEPTSQATSPKANEETVIIPPDPAILIGLRPLLDKDVGGLGCRQGVEVQATLPDNPRLPSALRTRISEEMFVPPSTSL